MKKAFSLVEMIVVLAIISVLSALIFPVFGTVRGKARQVSCASNLRQIGNAVQMYTQDYDGRFPYAVDPSDRLWPSTWFEYPNFQSQIDNIPSIQDSLLAYTSSDALFRCPSDTGFKLSDFTGLLLDAFPSSAEKFGTSYYYRTQLAASGATDSSVINPSHINLIFDGAGNWHGTLIPLVRRYNVLFVDGHVKNVTEDDITSSWQTSLFK